jgi:Sulfotransferase family
MIISPRHEFVFVHIPKCAGTSIRTQIVKCDPDCIEMGRVGMHPVLGKLDLGHVPLSLLRVHFPDRYDALRRFTSFAVVRDPLERFGSALRQVLWMYEKRPMTLIPPAEVRDRALRTIEALAARAARGETDLHRDIFFARQTDFIRDGGVRVTDHLIPLALVPDFIAYLSARTGTPMDAGMRANQNVTLRVKGLGRAAYALNGVLRRSLPSGLHARIKDGALRLLARPGRSGAEEAGVLDLPEVRAFVAEHYAEDIALVAEVTRQAPALRAALAEGRLDPAPHHGRAPGP